MTDAPDPGLTDLIAAHHPSGHYMATNEIRCGCGWLGPASDWPAHVALVVEQHTTVGSKQWRAMFRTNLERAEKAEAMIARVEKLAHEMRGWCSPHGISVTYSDRICAVLEGEWL